MITLLHSPRREMEVSFTSRGKKGRGDHDLRPSLLGEWMGCDHCHSISPPEGSKIGVTMASTFLFLEGGGSLIEKWRSVVIVAPISPPEGSRERVTMASTLLFLRGGCLFHILREEGKG